MALFFILALLVAKQAEGTIGDGFKQLCKNLFKTAVYGTGTVVTSALAVGSYLQAQQIPAISSEVFWKGVSDLPWTFENYRMLRDVTRLIQNSQPILYGASAFFGVCAAYSGFKTLKSVYKTITFKK